MSYTWNEERWGAKDINYRVPGRAFVGRNWKGWYHISLYSAAQDRWVREPGVYAHADEAREWAELLLEEQDILDGATTDTYRVVLTADIPARSAQEAIEIARRMSREDFTIAADVREVIG